MFRESFEIYKPVADRIQAKKPERKLRIEMETGNVSDDDQITVRDILKAIERTPLFGHTTGWHGKTHWMCFMKGIN